MTICYKQRVQLSVTLQLQVPNVTNNQPGNNRITENVIGYPGSTKKAGGVYGEKKAEMKRLDHGGYSLVELMVVIVIMVILASVSIGVYNGYVNRARSAVFYEKGHRIAEAFKICEAEHGLSGEFDKREMAEEIGNIMKKPNDPDSPLYLYVGEDTDDCTDFTFPSRIPEMEKWRSMDLPTLQIRMRSDGLRTTA